MSQPYLVRFVGAASGVSDADLYKALLRLLRGDENKVYELLDAPGTVIKKIDTLDGAEALVTQLRTHGIECRIDQEPLSTNTDAAKLQVRTSVTCPHCGTRQDSAENCRECGNPLNSTVAQLTAKKAKQHEDLAPVPSTPVLSSHTWNFKPVAIFLLVIAAGAYFNFRDLLPPSLGGSEIQEQTTSGEKSAPDSASKIILKGIFNAKGGGSGPSQPKYEYDPESGENPYKRQMEAMGIDPKELAKAHGVEGGIKPEQLNEVLSNSAVGDAVRNITGDGVAPTTKE